MMLWKMTRGQRRGHPPAAVSYNQVVQVVHASFVVVVVQDDDGLPVLTITELSRSHSCSSLGGIQLEWWWG